MITSESLRRLNNQELHESAVLSAKSERKIMHVVLLHIQEVERRMLYIAYECASIQQYCIKEMKYSEPAANRRVQAARLLTLLPEITECVESGALNLTTMTAAQSVMRAEEKRAGEKIHIEDKRELLSLLENKTTDQALRTLAQAFPDAQPPKEKTRPLADDKTQVSFVMPKRLAQKLERVREIESHKNDRLAWADLFEILADVYLDRHAPERKSVRKSSKAKSRSHSKSEQKDRNSGVHDLSSVSLNESETVTSATTTPHSAAGTEDFQTTNQPPQGISTQDKSSIEALSSAAQNQNPEHQSNSNWNLARPALNQTKSKECTSQPHLKPDAPAATPRKRKRHSVSIQRTLHLRSGSQCEHVDPVTGERCTRRFHLQVDHVQAFSRGGSDEIENLQLLCRAHNLWKGTQSMNQNFN